MLIPLPPRVIPVLLLQNDTLVKTFKFKKHTYVGDPINTVNLFNKFEVDEIMVLDITTNKTKPNFKLIEQIASECWVPITYGGGIKTIQDARRIFNCGVEKALIQDLLFDNVDVAGSLVSAFGSASIVGCINVKKNIFAQYCIHGNDLRVKRNVSLDNAIDLLKELDIGELVVNNISRDGTFKGYDLELLSYVSNKMSCPVIALGGAKDIKDLHMCIKRGAHAVAAGAMFVFSNEDKESVLVNFPERRLIEEVFSCE